MKIELSTFWPMMREDYKIHVFRKTGLNIVDGKEINSEIEIIGMCAHWDTLPESSKAKIHEYFLEIGEWV